MSVDFCPLKPILARDLFDGRLEPKGVREAVFNDTTETCRCLTDGVYSVWVYIAENGSVFCFTVYGLNDPGRILTAVQEAFNVRIDVWPLPDESGRSNP
jgi:hypothetical protein